MNTSAAGLKMQWASPSDVTSILMIIGGDVVQKALAQGTGKVYTPVCFSFGCVAYAFVSLVSIIGDGRLLPPPDYPAKVFNLDSGYQRENKNWVVGRILRDLESYLSRTDPIGDHGMRISVFEATLNMNGPASFSWGRIHAAGALITVLQLALAVVPIVLDREWTVMMIVVAGTFMVQITGWLPQWRAEKLPNRQRSNTAYALTSGNGSRDVIVIFGRGYCLDLEELCASGSPRTSRPWEKFTLFSKPNTRNDGTQELLRRESRCRGSINAYGLPMGFWITKIMSGVLSVFWLLLLINVAAEKQHTWYLLGIGATGMFQNAWLAATETSSERHNLPLILIDTIKTQKVMDCLMDFQTSYQQARPLLKEFFPGRLRPLEEKWWYGQGDKDKDPYDAERRKDEIARGRPKRPVKNRFQPSSVMTHGCWSIHHGKQSNVQVDMPNSKSTNQQAVSVKVQGNISRADKLDTTRPGHTPHRQMLPSSPIVLRDFSVTSNENLVAWPRKAAHGKSGRENLGVSIHHHMAAREHTASISGH